MDARRSPRLGLGRHHSSRRSTVIFIAARVKGKPEFAEEWLTHTDSFTRASRAEPGNLWFDWSRNVEDPNEYILLEAFADDAAAAHVNSAHFKQAQVDLPPLLQETPRVRNMQIEGDGWDELGEMAVN